MDQDARDLVRHLFAEITARLEDAHDAASAAQSLDNRPSGYQRTAERLQAMLEAISKLIATAHVLTEGLDRDRISTDAKPKPRIRRP